MTSYFVDTSAVAKRYLANERGASWVLSWITAAAGNIVVMTDLTAVEMFSLLARRVREGTLVGSLAVTLGKAFLVDVEHEYLSFPLEARVLSRARDLVNKYPLRALDSIQLAGALEAASELNEQLTFISADNSLLAAASSEGFQIDNPNAYP